MKPSVRSRPLRTWLMAMAYLLAAAAGVKWGFDFGHRISGTVLGVVLAINGALFCSFIVGVVVDRLFKPDGSDSKAP